MAFKESKPIKNLRFNTSTQDEIRDNILDKLNFRITFLSVFLPILLILSLVFTYFVMNYKIREKHDLALKEVTTISQDIEELKTFFSEQTLESKKSLMDRITDFNKTLEGIQKDIKKHAATVRNLKKTKTDKKTVSETIKNELSGVTKTLSAVRSDIKKQQKTITTSADQDKTIKNLTKSLSDVSTSLNVLKKTVEQQKSTLQDLSKTKADRKSLEKQERLHDKIRFLELELRLLKSQIQSGETTTVEPSSLSSPLEKKPATKKERIIEEEITR